MSSELTAKEVEDSPKEFTRPEAAKTLMDYHQPEAA